MRVVCFPLLGLAALACAACQSTHVEDRVAFDANDAAYIRKQGAATVEGEAFVTNENGRVVKAAGQIVWLVPATAYARQRFTAIYGAKKSVPIGAVAQLHPDADYLAYTRRTKTGSNGKFSFDNVAAGDYFVVSQMSWKKDDELFARGAAMYETAKVKGDEDDPVKVVVSGSVSGL